MKFRKDILIEILLLAAFFGAVWLLVIIYAEDDETDWTVINERTEEQIAELVMKDISASFRMKVVANDTFIQEEWDEILNAFKYSRSGIKAIYLIRSDEINAFTLPGNTVLLTSSLIEFLDNPEELIAVLAHELGHIRHHHVMENITEQFAISAIFLMASGGDGGMVVELCKALLSSNFSRDKEREADEYAMTYITRMGISSQALASFFEKLNSEKGELPSWIIPFSTHPLNEDRIRAVEKFSRLEKIKTRNFDVDWKDFQNKMSESFSGDD